MTWPGSIAVAILTGLTAMVAAGITASLAVEWYQIPGREGESGYFVIALALLGLLVGGISGLVVSRAVASSAHPGFGRALGISLLICGAMTVIGAGVARLLADVPPTIDGETLVLAVEVRYPASRVESPATDSSEGNLTLRSIPHLSHTVRISQRGPLWKADAHQVAGHWVVPGAVNIFTGRGKRMLEFNPEETTHFGFLLPLGGRPGRADLAWSEWFPRARPGTPPLPDQVTIRYRVQKGNEVIRVETVGPFRIGTMPGWYYDAQVDGRWTSLSNARFTLATASGPIVITDSAPITAVAVVNGFEPALVVQTRPDTAEAGCYYVGYGAPGVKIRSLGHCGSYALESVALTTDPVIFRGNPASSDLKGRIDLTSFRHAGQFLLGHTVLDTRNGAVTPFGSDTGYTPVPSVPPLGLSPDGRSLVRFGYARESSDSLVLAVTDFVVDHSYTLPVDPRRMRYPELDSLDPAWLDHHFEWRRGADGFDQLSERKHFVPIPYHGTITGQDNDVSYRIEKAGRGLRAVLVGLLISDFKAEPMPADSDAYELPVKVEGKVVNVATSGEFDYVLVSMPAESRDSALIGRIARRLDAALATGRYDSLFGP